MTEAPQYQLLISTFDNEKDGPAAAKELENTFKGQAALMPTVASVVHVADGSVFINESSELAGKEGAAAGALVGGVVGLASKRNSVLGTAALGAILGGFAAKMVDTGIPDERLKAIGEALQATTSAAVGIFRDDVVAKAQVILDGLGATTVAEGIDHNSDVGKQIQAGNYTGAVNTVANDTERIVTASYDRFGETLDDLLAQIGRSFGSSDSKDA